MSCSESITAPAIDASEVGREIVASLLADVAAECRVRSERAVLRETVSALGCACWFGVVVAEAEAVVALLSFYARDEVRS